MERDLRNRAENEEGGVGWRFSSVEERERMKKKKEKACECEQEQEQEK